MQAGLDVARGHGWRQHLQKWECEPGFTIDQRQQLQKWECKHGFTIDRRQQLQKWECELGQAIGEWMLSRNPLSKIEILSIFYGKMRREQGLKQAIRTVVFIPGRERPRELLI